ncbi:hypothetical protein E1B28_009438 [Marasmius oreades]|uniref:HMG box domain-containing protein n=1 Tax=Marasmius oreades TaxID=181124 RepID=A0A9P7S1S2_9AGAR|nr:uncharacterized protein E1B28_009438 [Marasmius oreades]KAG7093156.1 hypothetical protein E1B28_009438 [Marasmius oreades]
MPAPRRARTPLSLPLLQSDTESDDNASPGPKIPRPENAWMIFRKSKAKSVRMEIVAKLKQEARVKGLTKHGVKSNVITGKVSSKIGKMWGAMSDEEKKPFWILQRQKEMEHNIKYPGYTFKPRRNKAGTKATTTRKGKGKACAAVPSTESSSALAIMVPPPLPRIPATYTTSAYGLHGGAISNGFYGASRVPGAPPSRTTTTSPSVSRVTPDNEYHLVYLPFGIPATQVSYYGHPEERTGSTVEYQNYYPNYYPARESYPRHAGYLTSPYFPSDKPQYSEYETGVSGASSLVQEKLHGEGNVPFHETPESPWDLDAPVPDAAEVEVSLANLRKQLPSKLYQEWSDAVLASYSGVNRE